VRGEDWFENQLTSHIAVLEAATLEDSLKSLRKKVSAFSDKTREILLSCGISETDLPRYNIALPPFAVGNALLKEAKDKIQGLKERSYTDKEILDMAGNAMISDPLSLLHERKKNIKARAQIDLTRKLLKYLRLVESLRTQVLTAHSDRLPELFASQQEFLPSYARDKVS